MKGEEQMHRKIGSILLALLLVAGLGRKANAAEQTGSIRVTLKNGTGAVTLYCVGTSYPGGYVLTEAFGGGFIRESEAQSPYLAQWLSQNAENGRELILDADGSAEFSHLEDGLYLVKQTEIGSEETVMAPFLVTVPYMEQWDIEANPKTEKLDESPRTGQTPMPYIGATGMAVSGIGLLICARKRKRA